VAPEEETPPENENASQTAKIRGKICLAKFRVPQVAKRGEFSSALKK